MFPRGLRFTVVLALCAVAGHGVGSVPSGDGCEAARRLLRQGAYGAAEQEARNCAGGAESLGPDTDLLVAASYLNGKASSPALLATAEQVVASKRRHTTGGELQLAESLHNLGAIRAERGEFAQALPLHEEAYSLRLHALGADDSRLADSLDHVGWSLIRLERFEQAQSTLDRSLAIRESLRGDGPGWPRENARTVRAAASLPGVVSCRTRDGRSCAAATAARASASRTASLLHVRGDILFAMGEMHPAQESYAEALAMAEQTLGAAHPVVARYLRRVAHAESVFGDLARARSLRERALAVGEAGFAPCHPDLPAFRNDLALSLWSDGDYVAARRMYHRALDQNERCLGKGHSLTTTIVHNLGLLAADMGDRAEAERLQDRAVRDWSASMGADHPYVAMALDALAEAVEAQGRLLDTRKLYERAMAIRTRALGPGHSDVAWTLASLARIKAKSGDPSGALRDLTEALAMHDRASLSDQPDRVASLLVQKGEVERALGRYSSARVSYAEALSTRIRLFGESHPLAADTDARLAAVDFALGDFGHAMQEALRAEDIGRNHLRFLVRYLPERQGLAYSDKRARGLDLALSIVTDTAAVNAASVLDSLIRSRSLVLDELATRARTTRRGMATGRKSNKRSPWPASGSPISWCAASRSQWPSTCSTRPAGTRRKRRPHSPNGVPRRAPTWLARRRGSTRSARAFHRGPHWCRSFSSSAPDERQRRRPRLNRRWRHSSFSRFARRRVYLAAGGEQHRASGRCVAYRSHHRAGGETLRRCDLA